MWRGLQFANPDGVYLFLGLPILAVLWLWDYRARARFHELLVGRGCVERLLCKPSRRWNLVRLGTLALAYSGFALALMQPRGNVRYAGDPGAETGSRTTLKEEAVGSTEDQKWLRRRRAHQVIFLLDASASMGVEDTRVGKSRLEYGKELIEEVVSQLEGHQVAVYAFTSEVTTVVPLTLDYIYSRLMLRRVGINEGDVAGTDFVEALEFTRRRHWAEGGDGDLKTLILLSDGGDTHLERLAGQEREQELRAILGQVSDATAKNLRVFTVGMGTASGEVVPGVTFEGQAVRSSLDEDLLGRLAKEGRGRYYFANDYSALDIARDLTQILSRDEKWVDEEEQQVGVRLERLVEEEKERNLIYDEYFQYPLIVSLLALGLYLWMPRGKS